MQTNEFQELIGEDLSGVSFVRDYVQLQFNPPPMINAYTPVTVRCKDQQAEYGESVFANMLLGQINKIVREVVLSPAEALTITFDDGSAISISLRPEHYVGPEALNLFRKNGEVIVV